MKVWVVYTDAGLGRVALFGVAHDGEQATRMSEAGDGLRALYGVEGEFRRVLRPEAYYRADEIVYRNAWLTVVARPFKLDDLPTDTE